MLAAQLTHLYRLSLHAPAADPNLCLYLANQDGMLQDAELIKRYLSWETNFE